MDRFNRNFFYRGFGLDRAGLDKDGIPVTFSSEAPAMRWFGAEYLLHDKENVDLVRLKKVGAALMNHNPSVIVGPLKNIRLEDRTGKATVLFDPDEDGQKAKGKVESGSLKGVSVGYMVNKFREVLADETYELPTGKNIKGPAMVAIRWTPYEISMTPIPMDINSTVGREMTRSLEGIEIERRCHNFNQEETTMKISNDVYYDLLGRAGAVSVELKARVADMGIGGKTESEILRAIIDAQAGRTDSTQGRVTSFTGLDDDTFFKSLKSPISFDAVMPSMPKNAGHKRRVVNTLDGRELTSFDQIDTDTFIKSLKNPVLF
jgi:hypothetical protein